MTILRTLLVAAFAWQASAQTTTMQVPQGSGNYPTIGQIECLEEEGSGRYCAATWECSDGSSGTLWNDMYNHNGRQSVVPDHPIATRRDCVVEVDGKASVQWFHGFRPQGRDGSIVGLANAAALRPVLAAPEGTGTMANAPSGSMLEFILERHGTTIQEIVELACPIYGFGTVFPTLNHCLSSDRSSSSRHGVPSSPAPTFFAGTLYALALTPATPARQCVAEVLEDACPNYNALWAENPETGGHPWDCEAGGATTAVFHFTDNGFASWINLSAFWNGTMVDAGTPSQGSCSPDAAGNNNCEHSAHDRCGALVRQEVEELGLTVGIYSRLLWPEPDDEE